MCLNESHFEHPRIKRVICFILYQFFHTFVGKNWNDRLNEMINEIQILAHFPKPLKFAKFLYIICKRSLRFFGNKISIANN